MSGHFQAGDWNMVSFHICAMLLLCLSAAAIAQLNQSPVFAPFEVESSPPDPSQGTIRLDVVVTDKSGNPVTLLKQQDFTLRDNGQPGKIISFQAFDGVTAKPDPPVEIILVIDELSMTARQLSIAEHEAENFLCRNQGNLAQPVSIYRINNHVLSASAQPSSDGNMLADKIAHHREPRVIWKTSDVSESLASGAASSNPLHALIALGSIAIEERRRPGRKLLFWLGPGWTFNALGANGLFDFVTELSTRLREARIDVWSTTESSFYDPSRNVLPTTHPIYQEYLEGVTPETVDSSYLSLYVMATQSGGGILETRNDLAGQISKRVEEANIFYSLTFDPPRTNKVDEYHALKLEVDKPDLAAHTKTGYFDQPVFYDQAPAGIERVTVEQLEHALSSVGSRSDAEIARQLSGMELTERLSTARLATLEATLRGKKAREALVGLADQSVFLAPPAGEIPTTAPPDAATQRLIMSRTVAYVNKTIPKLPNFFAHRTMFQYHEPPRKPALTWKTAVGDQSLYLDVTFKATMLFRDGKEVVKEETVKGKPLKPGERNLNTVGTFGPLLATVLVGATAADSDLTWSRWEQGPNGPSAVFRYRVPHETPLFLVGFGYLASDDRLVDYQQKAPFHGEFAVDPASGAILRLTVQADLKPALPLARSGVMVEYGPVVIGETSYICPLRSISISRPRTVMAIHEWGENFRVYAPFESILGDMTYEKYHLFRPTARMLPGYTPAPRDK
jgi:VWFA-related protein